MAAMLDELTIEANEESFVIILQHGGNDVTLKQPIANEEFYVPNDVMYLVVYLKLRENCPKMF